VPQWVKIAEEKFLTTLQPIAGVHDAIKVREQLQSGLLPGGWFITWYEALSQAGKVEEMSYVHWKAEEDAKGRTEYTPTTSAFPRTTIPLTSCPRCGMTESPDSQPTGQWMWDVIAKYGRKTTKWLLRNRRDWPDGPRRKVRWVLKTARGSNGPRLIKAHCTRCGYTHMSRRIKPAYYWLRDLFDLIVVDEGTKIKNMDSQTSQAIQGLRAPHRLLLTGTPIKNYVPDVFALMWWAMGDNSPRFPFSRDGGQAKFEKEYSVVEYVIDPKHSDRKLGRKVLPQVSNLVSFWRLAHAGCIRRTKENAGVPIVPVCWHDLRAPFGKRQAQAYKHWLLHFASWYMEKHPDHPISQYPELIERSAGILGQFAKLQFMCTLPEAEPDHWADRTVGPVSNYTPKNVAVIRQTMQLVDQGRKVVIFSAVKQHSLWLANVLNRLGYPALSVVEQKGEQIQTISPIGRADLVKDFVQDGFPILCASIHAMNLGHNLDCASAVIVNGLPWDFATFDQAINRVHRITSKDPVDVYIAQTVCRENTDDFRMGASLDQKMRRLIRDKGECSALALDGALPEREEVTVNIQDFLDELARQWKEPIDTLDETDLERSLLQGLLAARRKTTSRPRKRSSFSRWGCSNSAAATR